MNRGQSCKSIGSISPIKNRICDSFTSVRYNKVTISMEVHPKATNPQDKTNN